MPQDALGLEGWGWKGDDGGGIAREKWGNSLAPLRHPLDVAQESLRDTLVTLRVNLSSILSIYEEGVIDREET